MFSCPRRRSDHADHDDDHFNDNYGDPVQVGPRPYYLINKMSPSPLKRQLESCADGPFYKTKFSIGHRGGGTLQFPEHTKESHEAGARMGAGIQECDVTFTKDGQLVCRHDQCDLHTTTNILVTPLAAQCTKGFTPAVFDASGKLHHARLGPVLHERSHRRRVQEPQGQDGRLRSHRQDAAGVPGRHGQLPHRPLQHRRHVLTHKESIELLRSARQPLHARAQGPQPRAKLQVEQVFGSQAGYAQAMINDYKAAGISPRKRLGPVLQQGRHSLLGQERARVRQAGRLPRRRQRARADVPSAADLKGYARDGIRIVAPPMWVLLTVENGKIVPSQYAKDAKAAKLDIITWTLERSGRIVEEVLPTKGTAAPSFYYQTTLDALTNDGDIMVDARRARSRRSASSASSPTGPGR